MLGLSLVRVARQALVVLLPIGCVPEFEDDLSLIDAPRVIAVRAEPAEAGPDEDVTLTALIAEPGGAGTAELDWALCVARKPLTELGPVEQKCVEEFGANSEDLFVELGAGLSVPATLPKDACRLFGPLAPPANEEGEAGRPVDPDLSGGYYQPVLVGEGAPMLGTIRIACGVVDLTREETIAFERGYRPNDNPAISAVRLLVDGVPLPEAETDAAQFEVEANSLVSVEVSVPQCPTEPSCGDGLCTAGENPTDCREDCADAPVGCAGAEVYLYGDAETRTAVERTEIIEIAWFTDAGSFDIAQTDIPAPATSAENQWQVPASPGTAHVWLVIRDNRGGVGWEQVVVRIEP